MKKVDYNSSVNTLIQSKAFDLEDGDIAIGFKAVDIYNFIKLCKTIYVKGFGDNFNDKLLYEYAINLEDDVVNITHSNKLVSIEFSEIDSISEPELNTFKDTYACFCSVPAVEYVESRWEYFYSFGCGVNSIGCFSISISMTHITIRFNGNTGLASPKFQEYTYPLSYYMSLGKPIFE